MSIYYGVGSQSRHAVAAHAQEMSRRHKSAAANTMTSLRYYTPAEWNNNESQDFVQKYSACLLFLRPFIVH